MKASYFAGWIFFRTLLAIYCRARYYNPERLPPSGPVILASNHASFLDPPLIGSGINRLVHFLARETLFRVPLVSLLFRAWEVAPVDRESGGASGIRVILDRLKQGGVILLFPEGTRTPHGALQKARSGIGLVVVKSNAPVVPVRVFGTFEALGRHLRFPRPRLIAAKYGKPMRFEKARKEAQTASKTRLKEIYQEIANEIMTAIAKLQPWEDKETFP